MLQLIEKLERLTTAIATLHSKLILLIGPQDTEKKHFYRRLGNGGCKTPEPRFSAGPAVGRVVPETTPIYGECEGAYRMTNMVLQSQASWAALERADKGKRLIRRAPVWLVEAVLRYTGKAVSVPSLQSMAVIYPFVLDQSLAYVISNYPTLELRSEGSSNQFVGLREII